MKHFSKIKANNGDTLVEVLIAIAIAGVVVGGAYALATRSLRQGIMASERTEALKIVESQIEALKFRQKDSSETEWNTYFTPPSSINNSCLSMAGTGPDSPSTWRPVNNSSVIPGNNSPDILLSKNEGGFYDEAAYPNSTCVISGKYFINITVPTKTGIPLVLQGRPTYLVTVRWEGFGGVQNQSQIYYRF